MVSYALSPVVLILKDIFWILLVFCISNGCDVYQAQGKLSKRSAAKLKFKQFLEFGARTTEEYTFM